MSLTVRAVRLVEGASPVPIDGAAMKAAGFETWRTDVWASSAVISLVETVRRPRPSRLILPSLAAQDVHVEGEELDQLEREVEILLAHAADVVRTILRGAPMIGLILDGSGTPHGPSEAEIVESFRRRLLNIKDAVQLARTVPRGGVQIT